MILSYWKTSEGCLLVSNWCIGLLWNYGNHVGLYVEQVRINFEERAQILGSLEKGGPQVYIEMVCHKLEKLINMKWTLLINTFTEKLQKLVGHYRIHFILVRLSEGARDFSFVFLEINNFFLNNKFFWVTRKEILKLFNMLAGNVAYFWWSLRPVAKQAFYGNLCASAVLPESNIINF